MTHQPADERQTMSLPRTAALSLVSTFLATFVASCAYLVFDALTTSGGSIAVAPVALFFVFAVGSMIAVPSGLMIGTPVVWMAQTPIARRPIIATILLGLLGCALGYPIEQYLDANSVQRGRELPLYMSWGAIVAGCHGLAVCWVRRHSIGILAKAAVVAALIVPIVAMTVVHLVQNASARRGSCESAVTELDHDLAIRADKAVATPIRGVDQVTASVGDWVRFEEGSSRAHSYSAIFVNGRRAIAINDEAVLPQSLLTDFGLPSAVERRCTDLYTGPHANLVRHFSRPVRLAGHAAKFTLRHYRSGGLGA